MAAAVPNEQAAAATKPARKAEPVKNYKGFVAGVFSGIAKLSGKRQQS